MKSLSTPYLCYFRSIQLNSDSLSSQLFLTVSVKLTFKQMIIMAVTSDYIDFYATWPVKIYYSRVKHEIIPHSINPKRYQWFGSFGDNFLPAIHDSVYYKNTLYRLILIYFIRQTWAEGSSESAVSQRLEDVLNEDIHFRLNPEIFFSFCISSLETAILGEIMSWVNSRNFTLKLQNSTLLLENYENHI